MKLLVNAPSGVQEIITLGEGGWYYDASRVLWDERTDGSLPAITIGGMVRVGNSLVVDSAMLAATVAANLTTLKAALLKQIDDDTDALIKAVIGERASEYERAEKDATAFKAAGYTGTIPSSVAVWATAKAWTATQAADDIIATATAWRTAQSAIRANRLGLKESARVAANIAGLDTVKAQWAGFLTAIKAQMGL